MAGDASANQTICYNTIPAQLNATAPTGGSGTLSYVWQVSSNNVDFTTIPDSSGLTYTPGLLTDTMYYRLLQIDTYCSPDDTVITDTITITVLPEFIAGNATANQTICYNTAPAQLNATAPTGGNGSYTYQWQVSSDNVTFNNITDSTSLVLSPGALTSTTYYRLAQTSGNSCGTIYTDTLTITVNPELTATTCVVTDPCQNGLGVITVNISGGTSTYTAKMTGKFNITTSQGAANSDVFSPAVKELSTTGSDTQVTFTGLFGNATYKILVQDSNNCTVGEIHPQP
jgi:hypothetical protein